MFCFTRPGAHLGTVDEFEARRVEELKRRTQALPRHARKLANGETRQFDGRQVEPCPTADDVKLNPPGPFCVVRPDSNTANPLSLLSCAMPRLPVPFTVQSRGDNPLFGRLTEEERADLLRANARVVDVVGASLEHDGAVAATNLAPFAHKHHSCTCKPLSAAEIRQRLVKRKVCRRGAWGVGACRSFGFHAGTHAAR